MTAKLLLPLFVLCALTATVSNSPGEQPSVSEAKALAHFKSGRALLKKRKYAKACAAFSESVALNPSVGAYLNLGECNQKLDRIASAKQAFDAAAALAKTQRDTERARYAAKRAERLAPRLSYIVVVGNSTDISELVVTLDGDTVDDDKLGKRIAADIGSHKLTAVRDDGATFEDTVTVAKEGSEVEVEISFPEAAATRAPLPEHKRKLDVSQPSDGAETSGQSRALPLTLLGGAVLLAGGGTLAGLSARSRWDEARACRETRCTQAESELADSATTRAHVATALLGAAAISAGISTWLLLRGTSESTEQRSVSVDIGPTSAAVRFSF